MYINKRVKMWQWVTQNTNSGNTQRNGLSSGVMHMYYICK